MIGYRFNKWFVIEESVKDKWGTHQFLCECDCGSRKVVRKPDLILSRSLQCRPCGYKNKRNGILRLKSPLIGKGHNYQHGKCGTPTYGAWCSMIYRCQDKNGRNYKWYGSRGITVCDRWLLFKNFIEDMGEKPYKYYLDRIDNDKGYFKDNCRWVDAFVNSQNRRCVRDKKGY